MKKMTIVVVVEAYILGDDYEMIYDLVNWYSHNSYWYNNSCYRIRDMLIENQEEAVGPNGILIELQIDWNFRAAVWTIKFICNESITAQKILTIWLRKYWNIMRMKFRIKTKREVIKMHPWSQKHLGPEIRCGT